MDSKLFVIVTCAALLSAACGDSASDTSDISEEDLSKLHTDCTAASCPPSMQCLAWYGVSGPLGPKYMTCEIPCDPASPSCPNGLSCAGSGDGPPPVVPVG